MHLILLMAGQGSRFRAQGENRPKPLLPLFGKPFFFWATQSVLLHARVERLSFVVLNEHIRTHRLDAHIRDLYPQASLLALDKVTSGAAETAWLALNALHPQGPTAFLDCDLAFDAPGLPGLTTAFSQGASAALCTFPSSNPAFSYVRLDAAGKPQAVVEKQVVSDKAVAGLYLFRDMEIFSQTYEVFSGTVGHKERYMSGLYSTLLTMGKTIALCPLTNHLSFGTPQELTAAGRVQQTTLPLAFQSATSPP